MPEEGVELVFPTSATSGRLADIVEESGEAHFEAVTLIGSRLEGAQTVFVHIIRMNTTLFAADSGFDFR